MLQCAMACSAGRLSWKAWKGGQVVTEGKEAADNVLARPDRAPTRWICSSYTHPFARRDRPEPDLEMALTQKKSAELAELPRPAAVERATRSHRCVCS